MLKLPVIGSQWVKKEEKDTENPFKYTILYVSNTVSMSTNRIPDVIYEGDNGHIWSQSLPLWPSNLVPFADFKENHKVEELTTAKTRAQKELSELQIKISSLSHALQHNQLNLPERAMNLMSAQLNAMECYKDILGIRLAYWAD